MIRLTVAVATLLLGVTPAPGVQHATKVATIGVLSPALGRNPLDAAFRQALQDLGWVTNQNVKIEVRYSAGRPDAFPSLAAELVGLGVDVLVAWGPPAAAAAKRATSQIPVVFLGASDPVRFGLVSSLARPGGNVTGVSIDVSAEIYSKRLQLLKEGVPALSRVAHLVPLEFSHLAMETRATRTATNQALNLGVFEIEVRTPTDLEAAIRRAKEQGAQALYVWTGSPYVWDRRLSELAIAHRLPSIHVFREGALAGGLFSYAASLTDIARRGAAYVDRILRGTKPGELPVEQPPRSSS